jgi:nucleoside phosphorylase
MPEAVELLFLTALDEELEALLQLHPQSVEGWETVSAGEYDVFKTTFVDDKQRPFSVIATAQAEMGPTNAAFTTKHMLEHFSPRLVCMTGITAGHPEKTSLGDVLISNKAFTYDEGKLTEDGFFRVSNTQPIHRSLQSRLQRFTRLHTGEGVPRWHSDSLLAQWPVVGQKAAAPLATVAPFASSNKVVEWDDFFVTLQEVDRKVLALEMEAASFLQTIHAHDPGLPAFVVKGVCDFANRQKSDDFHGFAAHASAQFALDFARYHFARRPSVAAWATSSPLHIAGTLALTALLLTGAGFSVKPVLRWLFPVPSIVAIEKTGWKLSIPSKQQQTKKWHVVTRENKRSKLKKGHSVALLILSQRLNKREWSAQPLFWDDSKAYKPQQLTLEPWQNKKPPIALQAHRFRLLRRETGTATLSIRPPATKKVKRYEIFAWNNDTLRFDALGGLVDRKSRKLAWAYWNYNRMPPNSSPWRVKAYIPPIVRSGPGPFLHTGQTPPPQRWNLHNASWMLKKQKAMEVLVSKHRWPPLLKIRKQRGVWKLQAPITPGFAGKRWEIVASANPSKYTRVLGEVLLPVNKKKRVVRLRERIRLRGKQSTVLFLRSSSQRKPQTDLAKRAAIFATCNSPFSSAACARVDIGRMAGAMLHGWYRVVFSAAGAARRPHVHRGLLRLEEVKAHESIASVYLWRGRRLTALERISAKKRFELLARQCSAWTQDYRRFSASVTRRRKKTGRRRWKKSAVRKQLVKSWKRWETRWTQMKIVAAFDVGKFRNSPVKNKLELCLKAASRLRKRLSL